MSKKAALIALVLVTSFALVAPAFAQGVQTATLRGTVTDETGTALPGVVVTAASEALQGSRDAVTGANGTYLVRGLPPGEYTITFTMDGMSTVEVTQTLELGQPADISPQLQATFEDVIIVTGESVSALESPTVGINLNSREVDTLPTGNRSLENIADLSPGLTQDSTEQVGGQVSISGGFNFDSVWLLDGVDITDPVFAQATDLFIEDAVEETQVLTSGISAEYGRFSGGVVNAITKSGGNEFSGSFRTDLTNPSWRDETPSEEENGIERESELSEVYSGTLGGRIIQDQLWFFAAARDQALSQQVLLARTNIPFQSQNNDERIEGKLTATVAEQHTLVAGFMDRDQNALRTSLNAGSTLQTVETIEFPQQLAKLGYNGVWTPSIFAEAQYSEKEFGFRHIPQDAVSTDIADSPIRCWLDASPCAYNAVYFDPSDPEDRNNEQLTANVSWFADTGAGTHDVKVGFEDFTNINVGGNSQSVTDWVLFIDPLKDANGDVIIGPDGDLIPDPVFGNSLGVFFEAIRGAELELQVQSYYVNDRWQLNDHWSFNLGARYEDVGSSTNAGADPVSTDGFSPRLAATYDFGGDGRRRLTATYGQYSGGYGFGGNNFGSVTNVGNPSYVYGPYIGPSGDVEAIFDPNNYFFVAGAFPTANVFFEDDTSSPEVDEFTLQYGMELPKGGFLELSFVDRETSNFVEDLIQFDQGSSIVDRPDLGLAPIELSNIVYQNTSLPTREYQAGILQGRYNLTDRWSVEGHWTHQFENDGDYEGETGQSFGASNFGDFPEFLDRRNFALGRLDEFTEDKIRVWTRYNFDLGRAGSLATSLLMNYESGGVFSFTELPSLTDEQLALDPGYASLPTQVTLFFGERGAGDYAGWTTFDLAAHYDIPVYKNLDVYLKAEMANILNEDKQIFWDTSISPAPGSPVDSLGRPTEFVRDPSFGSARNNADFVTPREYRFAVGFRF